MIDNVKCFFGLHSWLYRGNPDHKPGARDEHKAERYCTNCSRFERFWYEPEPHWERLS